MLLKLGLAGLALGLAGQVARAQSAEEFYKGNTVTLVISAAPGNCGACHLHTDPTGAWQASNSCNTCHGQPPVGATTMAENYATFSESATPHKLHAGATGYSLSCTACHGDTLANATHDTTPVKSYQSLRFDQYLDAQGQPLNPSGAYSGADGQWTCTGLYCHSDGSSRSALGATVKWMLGKPGAANPLTCSGCHGGIDAGATRIDTVAHALHLARPGITCVHCHGATVTAVGTDADTVVSGKGPHVNGAKDVSPSGTFNGVAVGFGFAQGADTCSDVTCHGAYADVAWSATAGSCANCHGVFADAGGMASAGRFQR